MRRTYKDYMRTINEIEERKFYIEKNINDRTKRLEAFNKELKALEEKHDVVGIKYDLDVFKRNKKIEDEKIVSIKLFIICEALNRFINHEYFKHKANWQKWLVITKEFKIKEEICEGLLFTDFFKVLKEEFEENDGNIENFVQNNDFPVINHYCYELAYYTCDDQYIIDIPKELVDNLDEFKEKFEKLIAEYDKLLEEVIKEKERNDKEHRRKMWEELKKEFGE